MTTTIQRRFWKITSFLLISFLQQGAVAAQSTNGRNGSLQEFFQRLGLHSGSSVPSFQEVLTVVDKIASASQTEITAAMPSLFATLSSDDVEIRKDAAFALTAIARRKDSARLLDPFVAQVGTLLSDPNDRLQTAGVYVLGELKPAPPPDAVPLLIKFLGRHDRDPLAQASSLSVLLRIAPENGDVLEAIKEFLQRPASPEVHIQALNELGNSHIANFQLKDSQIIDIVINSLDDPNAGVRFTAVQVIPRLGPGALLQAKPALERLTKRADESTETRAYARAALSKLSRTE